MDAIEQALNPIRDAINNYMSWADTPGSILTVLLPVVLLLGAIGKWLDNRSSYWRQT
jgi:hypothetical protein